MGEQLAELAVLVDPDRAASCGDPLRDYGLTFSL